MQRTASIDFLVVPTLTFKILFVLVVLRRWRPRLLLVVATLVTIHVRVGFTSVTVATAAIWLAITVIRTLADRVGSGRVDPDRLSGWFRRTRRFVYLTIGKIPVLGRRRRPRARPGRRRRAPPPPGRGRPDRDRDPKPLWLDLRRRRPDRYPAPDQL